MSVKHYLGEHILACHEMPVDIEGLPLAVSALLFDTDGHILLIKRGPAARDAQGLLEGVGGETDCVHTLKENLVREVTEELGAIEITVAPPFLVHRLEFDNRPWLVVSYPTLIISGQPHIMEPSKATSINRYTLRDWIAISRQHLSPSTIAERDVYKKVFGMSLPFRAARYPVTYMVDGREN